MTFTLTPVGVVRLEFSPPRPGDIRFEVETGAGQFLASMPITVR